MNTRLLWSILSMLLLGGCGAAPPAQPPLAGARIGGPFTLTDQDGRRVTDRSFAGRWRIVYFGYTYCPDVCPVDVARIAAGLKALAVQSPALAAKIVPIFVSVDPARDTPKVLKAFVGAFDPHMVGLTGTPAQIAEVTKSYGIYFRRHDPAPGGTAYLVDHSRQTYLMGPDGSPVALLPVEGDPQAIAAELQRWVR